jgi:hypothetical protein
MTILAALVCTQSVIPRSPDAASGRRGISAFVENIAISAHAISGLEDTGEKWGGRAVGRKDAQELRLRVWQRLWEPLEINL